jgi:hypothetical protein
MTSFLLRMRASESAAILAREMWQWPGYLRAIGIKSMSFDQRTNQRNRLAIALS